MVIKEKVSLELAEPDLGSLYGEEEITAINSYIKNYTCSERENTSKNDIAKFEKEFAEYIGTKYAVSINGGGTAIDMVLKYFDFKINDEVISPAINFHGTHLSILGSKAKLILCNSNEDLNISAEDLDKRITRNTKAVVITHMNGLACNMKEIKRIVDKHEKEKGIDIKIIGDAARACGSEYYNEKVGNYEWATFFSFQRKKQMNTLGEGGMIVTNDSKLYNFLLKTRSFGCKEIWGSNFKMTPLQAIVGSEQLKKIETNNNKRIQIARRRSEFFKDKLKDFVMPADDLVYKNTYYLYTLLIPEYWNKEKRDMLIKEMGLKYKIGCCVANDVTYKYSEYIRNNVEIRDLDASEKIADRIICIIIHPDLSKQQEEYINESFVNVVYDIEERYSD